MRWLKIVAGISYSISFIIAAALFAGYNFGIPAFQLAKLFLILGGMGFVLNLLSYKNDKMGNPTANLLFWSGALLTFIGLVFKLLFWPYGIPLLISGALLMGISVFLYRRKKENNDSNNEILDQL